MAYLLTKILFIIFVSSVFLSFFALMDSSNNEYNYYMNLDILNKIKINQKNQNQKNLNQNQ